jgi:hypothetical protein
MRPDHPIHPFGNEAVPSQNASTAVGRRVTQAVQQMLISPCIGGHFTEP